MDKKEMQERLISSTDEQMRVMGYSEMMLDIIDHAAEFTRGDLQGVVEAAVMKIMRNERERI